jgi:hypothetical protein
LFGHHPHHLANTGGKGLHSLILPVRKSKALRWKGQVIAPSSVSLPFRIGSPSADRNFLQRIFRCHGEAVK